MSPAGLTATHVFAWRHLTRHIWVIGVLLAMLTLIGSGLAIWDMHRRAIDDAADLVATLGIVLTEHALRYLNG
jgi:hypothetical protein